MYKVLVGFVDLKDNNHVYRAGDVFPRTGYKPSAARIAELSGTKNKRKVALIAAEDEPVTPVRPRGRKKNVE